MHIPRTFGEEFLCWFRDTTERVWAQIGQRPIEEGRPVSAFDWQVGTRWLEGLSEAEIEAIERGWSVRFPPDYRLFLRTLHATDRPMAGEGAVDVSADGSLRGPRDAFLAGFASGATKRFYSPGFYSWLSGDEVRLQLDQITNTLVDDAQGGFWLAEWGPHPSSVEEAEKRMRALIHGAPKIVPLYGHRCLVIEPCLSGNPVLSIWGTDTIIYGRDLGSYLINEFFELFESAFGDEWDSAYTAYCSAEEIAYEGENSGMHRYTNIPFWGRLVARNLEDAEEPQAARASTDGDTTSGHPGEEEK